MKATFILFMIPFYSYAHELQLVPLVNEVTSALNTTADATRPPGECEACRAITVDESPDTSAPISKINCPRPSLENIPSDVSALKQEIARATNGELVFEPVRNIENFRYFVAQMRQFPQNVLQDMKARGARIRVVEGNGVGDDPEYTYNFGKDRAGAGGWIAPNIPKVPTWIVLDKMFTGHGAASLFAHEHGHALDTYNGDDSISKSNLWKAALAGNDGKNIKKLIRFSSTGNAYHETEPDEIFAEVFAYYYACPESQNHLRTIAPKVADFLNSLYPLEQLKIREARAPVMTSDAYGQ